MEATTATKPSRPRKSYGVKPTRPTPEPMGRYTVTQSAKELGVHRNTITNLFNDGTLKAIDPTAPKGKLRFYGRELLRYWDAETRNLI